MGGNADQGPKFHQGLIKIRGPAGRDKFFNKFFQNFFQSVPRYTFPEAMHAKEDTPDISIQRGLRPVEGQAGYCSCSIRAEPRKREKFFFR